MMTVSDLDARTFQPAEVAAFEAATGCRLSELLACDPPPWDLLARLIFGADGGPEAAIALSESGETASAWLAAVRIEGAADESGE